MVGENLRHFVGRLEPLRPGVEHPFNVGEFPAGGETEQHVVGVVVVPVQEMDVVGGDNRNAELAPQLDHVAGDLLLPTENALKIIYHFLRDVQIRPLRGVEVRPFVGLVFHHFQIEVLAE